MPPVFTNMAAPLAKAAVAAAQSGLMIEVHNDPAHALSDGPQSLTFEKFEKLTGSLPYISLFKPAAVSNKRSNLWNNLLFSLFSGWD